MNHRAIWISIVAILLVSFIFYWIWAPESGERNEVKLDTTKEEVLKEVNEAKEYVKKTAEWAEKSGGEVAYFNPPEEHESETEPKEELVKYFIAGLYTNDIDIFLSNFHPETLSRDLFKSNNPDKDAVARELINKITRDKQLKAVDYDVQKGFWNKDSDALSINITYQDGKVANIVIDIVSLTDSHEEHEHAIFYITTSAWDIIKQIESST